MKIYASNQSDAPILQFWGTDLWVRGKFPHGDEYYFKVAYIIHEDFGKVYIFPVEWVYQEDYIDDEILGDYRRDWLEYPRPTKFSEIKLSSPLEILTTEELYEILGIK